MVLPARLKRALLQRQRLQDWGPFSIAERLRIIDRAWNIKVNWTTLVKFYKANKIKYLRSREVYNKALRNHD